MVGGCASFSPCNHGLMAQSASCAVMEPGVIKKTLPRPIFLTQYWATQMVLVISCDIWIFFSTSVAHGLPRKSLESLEECGLGGGIMHNAIYA